MEWVVARNDGRVCVVVVVVWDWQSAVVEVCEVEAVISRVEGQGQARADCSMWEASG